MDPLQLVADMEMVISEDLHENLLFTIQASSNPSTTPISRDSSCGMHPLCIPYPKHNRFAQCIPTQLLHTNPKTLHVLKCKQWTQGHTSQASVLEGLRCQGL
jgi:hypothetical protein